MRVREGDKLRLTDGRIVSVIDNTKPGIAYLVEIPTPGGPSMYDDFFVRHEDVKEVLPWDYPTVNPYE